MKALVLALALMWGPAAQAAETVALRAAPHSGYARIVFDWKKPASYETSLAGRILTVRFARPFAARLDIVPDRLPDHVASARLENDQRTVTVALKGDYRLRPRADGGLVILDLLDDKTTALAAPKAKVEATEGSAHKPASALSKPAPAQPAPAPVKSASASEKPAPASENSAPAPKKSTALDEAVQRALKPTPIVPNMPMPTSEKRAKPGVTPFVSVDVEKGRDISTLRFNWRENVGAAVFLRRGQLWILFDGASRIELGSLRVNGAPVVTGAEQTAVVGGTAVRLFVDPSRHARVRREGTVWIVEILNAAPAAGRSIDVVAEPDRDGGRVVLPIDGGGKVLRLRDPEVGDHIDVIPVTGSGLGVAEAHRFVEFEVLESAQGIAIRPLADRVAVESAGKIVVVAKPGGLNVSRDAQRASPADAERPRSSRLFDFAAWMKGPGADIAQSREELFRRAAGASGPGAKRAARLNLVRFYVGNGFGPEALGVIHEIARGDDKGEDVTLRALRGVARVLAGEYGLANDDLRHPVLEGNAEVAPWRATIAAARGDWKSAQQLFRDLEAVWDGYPTWLAARLGLIAAEASLAVGDTGTASARISALDRLDLDPANRDALAVLRGYLMKLSGDADGAISIWQEVARSNDRKVQARARYALANTQFERNEATLDETIDRMERLRYAWRGDVHEFDLLRRIAQLYIQRGDNRSALQTLKEAATYFRDIEGVETVAQDMARTFRHLFAEGGAQKLDAVTALALFDEFRELTPAGAEGEAMIRNLAERLASVDLLDDAARLLENQVKQRLKGEEKARVGLRLATLRLADRKPDAALEALAESAEADVPSDLAHDRRLVQARALAAAGKDREALAVMAADNDAAAERIRATVLWRAKSWKPAAEAFARLIAEGKIADTELPGLVISRAVALTLAGDDKGISALYDKYAETMKKSPYADAFVAVAGPGVGAARDFRAAARIANEITSLEALLDSKKTPAGS